MKKSIFIVGILIIVIAILLLYQPKKLKVKRVKKDSVKEDIVEVVSNKLKDENIDTDFIKWVNDNYPEALKELGKLLKKNNYNVNYWHDVTGNSYNVLNDLYNNKYDNIDNVKVVESESNATISFVGDVSLADNWYIAPKYDEGGINRILSSEILDIMKSSDVMMANSEFTVSNRGKKLKKKTYTFRAKPERLSIYDEMGVDLVTLANNHVYDYGLDAFNDMLDAFKEYKIPHIGAGHNLEEASKPYYFIINGYKIAFVNANRSEKNILTPGATDNSGGVFRCYDPTNMINKIKEVKQDSDYVVAIIHYGRENSHELESEQVSSSKAYIDAGADMVVGHHAQVLQGIEFYNHKPIIYNLGIFLFNDEVVDTAIFKAVLNDNGEFDYYIIPALQKNENTSLLDGDDKQRVINDLNSYSINAKIDEDGKINEI